MTARPCVPYPAQILRQKATDVPEITDAVRALWADMVDTMDAMPGYGLAAVQIGHAAAPGRRRLLGRERGQAVLMANPEILHASGPAA